MMIEVYFFAARYNFSDFVAITVLFDKLCYPLCMLSFRDDNQADTAVKGGEHFRFINISDGFDIREYG